MWSDWVSNPGPLAQDSDILPTALRGPVISFGQNNLISNVNSSAVHFNKRTLTAHLCGLYPTSNKTLDTSVASLNVNINVTFGFHLVYNQHFNVHRPIFSLTLQPSKMTMCFWIKVSRT